MAVVQSPYTMTLGQQAKIYNVIQQSPQHQVIITGGGGGGVQQKTTAATTTTTSGKRPLAPAPERTSVLVGGGSNNDLRCKRKIQFVPYGGPQQQQPASVARRNARERNRVKQVNNGFATLRQHIPQSVAQAFAPQGPSAGRGASKKLSKVETLRLAVEYIRSLQQMIDDHENDISSTTSNDNLQENSRFYNNSPEQYTTYPILLPTPTCSEASVSPTPSHSSEGSFSATSSSTYSNTIYHQENFENYDPKSPEDEELLDAIFSWQQND